MAKLNAKPPKDEAKSAKGKLSNRSVPSQARWTKEQWKKCFLFSVGGILLFAALEKLATFPWSPAPFVTVFNLNDPILGISFAHSTVAAILSELILASLCLFSKRSTVTLILVVWLTLNFFVYQIGLWIIGWHHPLPSSLYLIKSFGFPPVVSDLLRFMVASYILICGGIVLIADWNDSPLRLKIACPSCGGHIRFASANLGQHATCPHCQKAFILRMPDDLIKTSCFFCREHIEFPAHALGRKIMCPHCKMEITLKDSTG
jgi:hypothetical protein